MISIFSLSLKVLRSTLSVTIENEPVLLHVDLVSRIFPPFKGLPAIPIKISSSKELRIGVSGYVKTRKDRMETSDTMNAVGKAVYYTWFSSSLSREARE